MGFYYNDNGTLKKIAGKGVAEYGASTIRTFTGSMTVQANNKASALQVVFDTPMPDTDYLISYPELDRAYSHLIFDIYNKTVNGFTLYATNEYNTDLTFNVTVRAYKLYTDIEYNSILNKIPDLLDGRTTILTSSDDLDAIEQVGTYSWNDTANAPANVPGNLTYAILFHVRGAASGANEQQLVFKGSEGAIYMRSLSTQSPRVWGPWNQVDYHKAILKTKSIVFNDITIPSSGFTPLANWLPTGETIPSQRLFAEIANFNGSGYSAECINVTNEGGYLVGKPNGVVKQLMVKYFYY